MAGRHWLILGRACRLTARLSRSGQKLKRREATPRKNLGVSQATGGLDDSLEGQSWELQLAPWCPPGRGSSFHDSIRVSPFYCDCKGDQGEAHPLVLPANAGPTNRESCKGLGRQMEGPDAHLQRTIEKMKRGQAVPKYQCFPDLGPRDCSGVGVAPGIYKTPNLISNTSGFMVMLDAPPHPPYRQQQRQQESIEQDSRF